MTSSARATSHSFILSAELLLAYLHAWKMSHATITDDPSLEMELNDSDYDIDDFEYDGRPYRFEPEYTDEEIMERRKQREAEEQRDQERQAAARPRQEGSWWCSCGGHCTVLGTEEECLCCFEWDLRPREERLGDSNGACLSTLEDVRAMLNKSVIETFFRVPKLNWKTQPKPAGANGQLSAE